MKTVLVNTIHATFTSLKRIHTRNSAFDFYGPSRVSGLVQGDEICKLYNTYTLYTKWHFGGLTELLRRSLYVSSCTLSILYYTRRLRKRDPKQTRQ